MNVDKHSAEDFSPAGKKRPPALTPRAKKIISFILTFVICFVTWIILSGRFDLFHLGLGVVACTIVASISGSILISRREIEKLPHQWLGFIRYVPWLLYQVLLANLHVMYLVFNPE